jgi:hypothetical protein
MDQETYQQALQNLQKEVNEQAKYTTRLLVAVVINNMIALSSLLVQLMR